MHLGNSIPTINSKPNMLYINILLFLTVFPILTSSLTEVVTVPCLLKGREIKRIVRETLYITEGIVWTDGNPRSGSILINGSSPGPTLRFRVGDLGLIKVYNHIQSDQNTTIHFHGISQSFVPPFDGTPMISQWPIAPFNFFEYQLHFTQDDVGTTFYHSHVGVQIMTAYGPLIVEEERQNQKPKTIPKQSKEKIFTVGDYFYQSNQRIIEGLLADPFVWPGSAKSVSLNGKAWPVPCNSTLAEQNEVDCKQTTYTGPEVFDVDYTTSYRLRWIGAQSLMHLAIEIFDHNQTIVAVDGSYIEPIQTNFIEIMSGQRYDTILHTKSKQAVKSDGRCGCYPIRTESRWRKPETNGWAMVRYPGYDCDLTNDPMINNVSYLPQEQFGWISDQFHPLMEKGKHSKKMARKMKSDSLLAPSDQEVDRRIIFQAQQVPISNGIKPALRWDTNKHAYDEFNPKIQNDTISLQTPYLIQLFEGQKVMPDYQRAFHHTSTNIQQGYDEVSNTYVGLAGEVIDIVIINNGSAFNHFTESHPWHFHSQDHWTIAMGIGEFSEKAFEEAKMKFYPAIHRDTSGVWPGLGASSALPQIPLGNDTSGAWTVLRYRVPSDEAASGVWLLHCHWIFHQIMGMSIIWFFGPIENALRKHYSNPDYLNFGRNFSGPANVCSF